MPKKIALFLLLLSSISYAQLSVRNNAYVFVKDQIVFVNDNINLNETNSKIYLRNEAQIIQGSGTTGNSGEGELSVYQEGNVGAYEYNYWCSPIGLKTNNSINNPFGITLLNDVTGLITSTPAVVASVAGFNSTSSPLTIEPYWIWKYIAGTSYSDWIHIGGNTTINPGEGFTMKGTLGSGDAQRYDFRGKPNTGTIAINVSNNEFTLVGNPYPSAIDALAYIHDIDNAAVMNGTLYYWEQDPSVNSHYLADYQGGYATYTINLAGDVETSIAAPFNTYNGDGSINVVGAPRPLGNTPKRYIPIGQGFMVEGTATGTVRAKNSHRVYVKESAPNSEFFKTINTKENAKNILTNNGYSEVPDDYKRFRLNVDFNDAYTRQLVETFHTSATTGFDYGLESKINSNDILNSDAFWSHNNKSFLAEALPFDSSLKIPLTIKVANNMPIKIRISDIQNFEGAEHIYIHDIVNDIFVDLLTHDFDINLESGNYSKRFEVTFNKTTLNNNLIASDNFNVIQNNLLSRITISNPNSQLINSFQLYEVSGKLVINENLKSNETSYSYSSKSLSDGVYIAKINLNDYQSFSKKIVISNKK